MLERLLLLCKRFSLDERVLLVARRFLRNTNASLINSCKRSMAISRFIDCERFSEALTRKIPSFEILPASLCLTLAFCHSVKVDEDSGAKHTVTRVAHLLTFCPPGPVACENSNQISFSSNCGIVISSWY